jgi:hypothetical protein
MPSIRFLAVFSILGASHAFIVPPMPSTVAPSSALQMAGFGAAKGNDGGSKLPKLKAKAQWDRWIWYLTNANCCDINYSYSFIPLMLQICWP